MTKLKFKKGDIVYQSREGIAHHRCALEIEIGVVIKAWPKAAIRVRWPSGEGYFNNARDWLRLYCRAI